MKNKKEVAKSAATNRLYFTSDNLAYLDEEKAMRHASRLKDKTITTMSQNEADKQLAVISTQDRSDELELLLDELTSI